MKRRDILTAAQAAPLLASPAVAVAKVMTRDEQISHHKQELFRLFAEQVPDDAKLTGFTLMLDTSGADFNILTAEDEQARYLRHHDGRWTRSVHKDKARALVGEV